MYACIYTAIDIIIAMVSFNVAECTVTMPQIKVQTFCYTVFEYRQKQPRNFTCTHRLKSSHDSREVPIAVCNYGAEVRSYWHYQQ